MRSFSGPCMRIIPHEFVGCCGFDYEGKFVMDDARGFRS